MKTINTNLTAVKYSVATLTITAVLGIIIRIAFPSGGIARSIFFILMNLTPMIVAFVVSKAEKEINSLFDFLKHNFLQRELFVAYVTVLITIVMYYGVSILLGNVNFTGASLVALLSYVPWTILQGGLEEVGWRWYLQPH